MFSSYTESLKNICFVCRGRCRYLVTTVSSQCFKIDVVVSLCLGCEYHQRKCVCGVALQTGNTHILAFGTRVLTHFPNIFHNQSLPRTRNTNKLALIMERVYAMSRMLFPTQGRVQAIIKVGLARFIVCLLYIFVSSVYRSMCFCVLPLNMCKLIHNIQKHMMVCFSCFHASKFPKIVDRRLTTGPWVVTHFQVALVNLRSRINICGLFAAIIWRPVK